MNNKSDCDVWTCVLCLLRLAMYGTYALFQIRQMPMQISMTKKTSLCHVLPCQHPRAATSTLTERLLAQHVSTYEPNTCQPMSPTRFNQRAQHVSIYQPYTCQPCDHTRVCCKPAETVQWRGKNRHGCNDIYDKIHKIVKVQQLWRYKDDEDDFVIASSQIYVHDIFGLYYDKSGLSWMWTFLVVKTTNR